MRRPFIPAMFALLGVGAAEMKMEKALENSRRNLPRFTHPYGRRFWPRTKSHPSLLFRTSEDNAKIGLAKVRRASRILTRSLNNQRSRYGIRRERTASAISGGAS